MAKYEHIDVDKLKAQGSAMKTIVIDGMIGKGEGEYSAAMMREQLQAANGDPIRVIIHSEGGSVYEGNAIHDMIADYAGPKTATIQSMAFSIASFIVLAFDDVEIAPNGWMMLHNPYVAVEGDDKQLDKVASQMRDLRARMVEGYSQRMNATPEQVETIMAAETFLSATQAVEMGIADRVTAVAGASKREPKSLHKLPHGVVSALFGNSQPDFTKDEPMSQTPERVAATARAIRTTFPKAKAEFVVRCMEKEMSMDEVKDEYHAMSEEESETMAQKLDELMAAKAAVDEELAAAKSKIMAMEQEAATAKATGPQARYRAGSSALPTGGSGSGAPQSAAVTWLNAVKSKMDAGLSREKAALSVEREAPELRQAYVAELNS